MPNKAVKKRLSRLATTTDELFEHVYPENFLSNFIPPLIEAPLGMPWEGTF